MEAQGRSTKKLPPTSFSYFFHTQGISVSVEQQGGARHLHASSAAWACGAASTASPSSTFMSILSTFLPSTLLPRCGLARSRYAAGQAGSRVLEHVCTGSSNMLCTPCLDAATALAGSRHLFATHRSELADSPRRPCDGRDERRLPTKRPERRALAK